MLSGLSQEVAGCYQRAAECQQLARLATSGRDREFYREREKGWVLLARTHRLVEGIGLTIEEFDRQGGLSIIRSCPACKKATPIHYDKLFVCTNCRLVFEPK
jgi:hypothetical protein